MDHSNEEVNIFFDRMTKINRAWHTREAEMVRSTSIRKMSTEEWLKEEAKEERMTQLMTQIELLTKYVIGAPTQKVNVLAANDQGYIHEDAYHSYDEKSHYINN